MSFTPSFIPSSRRFDQGTTSEPAGDSYSYENACALDGSNDHFLLASEIALTTNFTIGFMFKAANFDAQILLSNDDSANRYIFLESTTIISVSIGGSEKEFTVPGMSTDTWYNVMITRTGDNTKLYLNGVESSSGALDTGGLTFNIQIFGAYHNISLPFEGVLDEFYFWSGVVATEANAVSIAAGEDPEVVISDADHVYRFNESSGTNLPDTGTATASDGTLTNAASPDSNWEAH